MRLVTVILLLLGASRAAGADPTALIQRTNGQVRIYWGETNAGFTVESSTNIRSPAVWRMVPLAPTAVGTNHALVFTPDTNTFSYYRLRFPAYANPARGGLAYLLASQNTDGTWDTNAVSVNETTALVYDLLARSSRGTSTLYGGVTTLRGLPVRNYDELSRKIMALVRFNGVIAGDRDELIEGQSDEIDDDQHPSYPGLGWGLARGYGMNLMDSALAFQALRTAGMPSGLSFYNLTLGPGATSRWFSVEIPEGADSIMWWIRSSDQPMYVQIWPPGEDPYEFFMNSALDHYPLGVPPGSPGVWQFAVRNAAGSSLHVFMDLGFTLDDGFDVLRLSGNTHYLRKRQNANGGWGYLGGWQSQLLPTYEVMKALALLGETHTQALGSATTWIRTIQNPDGGFSVVPSNSSVYETSIAMAAIRLYDPLDNLVSATTYLTNRQQATGGWSNSPFLTAMAVEALSRPPVISSIPDQDVLRPATFSAINLDNFVVDPNHSDTQLVWAASASTNFAVAISNRIATVSVIPSGTVSDVVSFTATDPDGFRDSVNVRFTAREDVAIYVMTRNTFTSGVHSITGSASLVSQIASYSETFVGLPPTIAYTLTDIGLIDATTVGIAYDIDTATNTPFGVTNFTVRYQFFNSGSAPLSPFYRTNLNVRVFVQ